MRKGILQVRIYDVLLVSLIMPKNKIETPQQIKNKAKLLNEIKLGLKEAIKISKGEAKGYSMADLLGREEVA